MRARTFLPACRFRPRALSLESGEQGEVRFMIDWGVRMHVDAQAEPSEPTRLSSYPVPLVPRVQYVRYWVRSWHKLKLQLLQIPLGVECIRVREFEYLFKHEPAPAGISLAVGRNIPPYLQASTRNL